MLEWGALVLAREMTWGPCFVSPKTSKDIGKGMPRPRPSFRWLAESHSGIVFDLLSILTSHRVQVLSVHNCAPEFVDVNSNFGPGSCVSFLRDDRWAKKEFTQEHVSDLQDLLLKWSGFKGERDTLELAVNRLASSIQRNRGQFWLQDRILDTAIALEVMYKLNSSEISYKLAVRAGHLLANKIDKRVDFYKKAKAFYRSRSSITHGEKKQKGNIKEAADSGFDLALMTLEKLLEMGKFPDWDKLVMS